MNTETNLEPVLSIDPNTTQHITGAIHEGLIDQTPIRTNTDRYPITIEFLNRGSILSVGCQRVAVESDERLISLLTQYISNPQETTEKYYNNTL